MIQTIIQTVKPTFFRERENKLIVVMNSKEKNILHIANYSAHYRGNFIESLTALENSLKVQNINSLYAFYLSQSGNPESWMEDMKNNGQSVEYLSGDVLKDAFTLYKIASRHHVKIMHTHFISMKQYLSVLLVSMLCGCKIVMHFHNHSKEAGLFKNTLRRCLYSNCYMVACSESVLKSIIRDYPDNPKCAVDNGVYFNRIAPLKAASRKDYGLRPDSIVCLIFGFDFYRKGVDLAIKAINRLRESEAYPFELLISLSSNFEFVENETRKILGDIPDWIHIIKARNDVYQLYNLADIFLSPSREEGLPYSVLEASYCKCSVIMSDISAQKYLKIPYGVWHKEENDEDLQEKILEAISMKKLKDNNLNSVRSEMEQHYGLDNWVNQMIAVYSSHGL